MENILNKTISIEADGKNYVLKVIDFNEFELVGVDEKNKKTYHIPKFKMGVYSVLNEPSKHIFVYVCKNETSLCKGMRMLSFSEDLDSDSMQCPLSKEHKCFFKKAGSLFEYPQNIQLAIMSEMKTSCPVVKTPKVNNERLCKKNK